MDRESILDQKVKDLCELYGRAQDTYYYIGVYYFKGYYNPFFIDFYLELNVNPIMLKMFYTKQGIV